MILDLWKIKIKDYFVSTLALAGEKVTLKVEGAGGVALAGLAALRGESVVLRKTHFASLTRYPGVAVTFKNINSPYM